MFALSLKERDWIMSVISAEVRKRQIFNLIAFGELENATLTMFTPPLENVRPAPFFSSAPVPQKVANCADTLSDNYDTSFNEPPFHDRREFIHLKKARFISSSLVQRK